MQATEVTLRSRVLRLPLAFQERWTHGAIQKYMRSVRPEGPYLPSNVDFVAANNGLASAQQVRSSHRLGACGAAAAGLRQAVLRTLCAPCGPVLQGGMRRHPHLRTHKTGSRVERLP